MRQALIQLIRLQADLDSIIEFKVMDGNLLFKNSIIGASQIKLQDLLQTMRNQEIQLDLESQAVAGKQKNLDQSQYLGTLRIIWNKKPLGNQSTVFDNRQLPSDAEYKKALSDPRQNNGVLQVTLHHVDGLDPKATYQVDINVTDSVPSGLTQFPALGAQKTAKKKPPFQLQTKFAFPIKQLFNSELSFSLSKGTSFNTKQVGWLSCNFRNSLDLLKGDLLTLEFTQLTNRTDPSDTTKPIIVVQLQYFNSSFTRFSQGDLSLKVRAGQFNSKDFPTDITYLSIKVQSASSASSSILTKTTLANQNSLCGANIVAPQGTTQSFKRLGHARQFMVKDPTDIISIVVQVNKKLAKDPELASYQIRAYELFANDDAIMFQDVYYKLDFTNVKEQAQVFVTFAARFRPANITESEYQRLKAIEEQKNRIKRSPTKTLSIENLKEKKILEEYDENELLSSERNNSMAGGAKVMDEDIFTLNLATLPTFAQSTRGILNIRINTVDMNGLYSNQEHAKIPHLYFLIKGSKMVVRTKTVKEYHSDLPTWNEVYSLKTYDPFETLTLKLYAEGPTPELLAEGKIVLKDTFEKVNSWTKLTTQVILQLKKPTQVIKDFLLKVDLQFRVSKFTRMPRGKLELILGEGVNLMYRKESFRPILEFKIDNIRYKNSEDVQSTKAHWKNKLYEFETQSIWELLELRIFVQQESRDKGTYLNLIGSYQRPLHSIFYDDQMSSKVIIDLNKVDQLLSGRIEVQFEYRPNPNREGHELEKPLSLATTTKSQNSTNDSSVLTTLEKKRGVCYLTLFNMRVQNVTEYSTYSVENIRLEMQYGNQRCLSRITSDLNKTGSKEQMEDLFRLCLDDISSDRVGRPEPKIYIRAFDIDFASNFTEGKTQNIVGEAVIEPWVVRGHQGQEMLYQCAIKVSEIYFMQKKKTNIDEQERNMTGTQGNDEFDGIQEFTMDQISEDEDYQHSQKKHPELLINFQLFFLQTSFTRNPLAIVTLNDLTLLNLQNYLPDLVLREAVGTQYVLQFKLNKNNNLTQRATAQKNQALVKEHMCLFHQEYQATDVLRMGKIFYANAPSIPFYLKWSQQMVLHTTSATDTLEIKLIQLKKVTLQQQQNDNADNSQPVPSEGNDDPATTTLLKPGKSGANTNVKKTVLSRVLLSLADLSYYLDQSPVKESSVAVLMDFMGQNKFTQAAATTADTQDVFTQLKLQRLISSKDLTSRNYSRQLILMMDVKMLQDIFEEGRDYSQYSKQDNVYYLPREVRYDEHINEKYEDLLALSRKRKESIISNSSLIKNDSISMTKVPSGKNQLSGATSAAAARNILIEVQVINMNSILRSNIKASGKTDTAYAFLVIEPLKEQDSLKTYMKNVLRQVAQHHSQSRRLPHQALDEGFPSPLASGATILVGGASATGSYTKSLAKKNLGYADAIENFFALQEDLLRPEKQVSPIFSISDFEIHSVNQRLEAWVPATQQRLLLSMVVEFNDFDKLEQFRQVTLQNYLTADCTLKGLHQILDDTLLNSQVKIYQSLLDFQSTLASSSSTMTMMGDSSDSFDNQFLQCCSLSEISLFGNLLQNPMPLANCFVRSRVQTSRFIDMPSGYLNLALRKIAHNSVNFAGENNYVRVELKSCVGRDRVMVDQKSGALAVKDSFDTAMLSNYKFRTGKRQQILLNEVCNFMVRHYSDQLVISIYNKPVIAPTATCIFRTKVELNNLQLNEDKLSIAVVGTGPMRSKGLPVYYTFELDLQFKPQLATENSQNSYEMMLMNYKLMKNSERISRGEEEILKMMLALKQKVLTKSRVKLRKCRFLLRNMNQIGYQSLHMDQQAHLRVNLKSFLFNLSDPTNVLSEKQQSDLIQSVKQELNYGRVALTQQEQNGSKPKNFPLEKNGLVEKSNNLMIEFKSNISLQASATQKFKYKRLVLICTQEQQTVSKVTFDKRQLVGGEFLMGLRLMVKNVGFEQTLTFRLLVEEDTEEKVNVQQAQQSQSAIGQQNAAADESKLSLIGMGVLKLAQEGLLTWVPKMKTISIGSFNVDLKLTLFYSEFTKNPHKVVFFTFHRLIQLHPHELISTDQALKLKQLQQTTNEKANVAAGKILDANKLKQDMMSGTALKVGPKFIPELRDTYKIVLKEQPIITKEKQGNNLEPPSLSLQRGGSGSKMMGSAFRSYLKSKGVTGIQEDSMQKNLEEEQGSSHRFKLLLEFDNCLEYQGEIKDHRSFEINQYGKCVKPELNKITINNTKAENQLVLKLCIDNSNGSYGDAKNPYMSSGQQNVVIGMAHFNLAEVQTSPHQQLNFYIPLKALDSSMLSGQAADELSLFWAKQNYQINDLYVLASIKITDKTFGELICNFDQLESIPKSLNLREIQWRVGVQPVQQQTYSLTQLPPMNPINKDMKQLSVQQLPPDHKQIIGDRISYEYTISNYKVDRELVFHLQLKDIFSDQESFLKSSAIDIYKDQDTYLIFELLGFDDDNQTYVLGQKKLSMIQMIQKQILYEREREKEKLQLQNMKTLVQQDSGASQEIRQKALQSAAEKKVETEFSQCSAKFQRLFKDTYVRFNQTKEDIKQKRDEKVSEELKRQRSPDGKKREDLEDGYVPVTLKRPDSAMETQLMQSVNYQPLAQLQLIDGKEADMIVKIEFNFSYKARTKHSDKYLEVKEELRRLERIKQKKNINNLVETLEQVKTDVGQTVKNLTTLSLVLASESCMSLQSSEEMRDNQVLQNVERIIEVIASIYKSSNKEHNMNTIINMMRTMTYLKITCQCDDYYMILYKKTLLNSCLVETMIDCYMNQQEYRSKILSIEFMTFLSTLLLDFEEIYFTMISGVRLDPLLEFINIDNKDCNIVNAFSKFLNAVGQCLFKFDPSAPQFENEPRKLELIKIDMHKIAQSINGQLMNLVDGLSVYKNDYEIVSQALCTSALQFIHVSLLKSRILQNDEGFTLPDIMLSLFKILVDGIISQLSIKFIQELKQRLNYELSLIRSLDLRQKLLLCFDGGKMIGMIERVSQHFLTLLQTYDQMKREHGMKFFEKTKLIFEFFATENELNIFAEKNVDLIKQILNDRSVENIDFIVFLQQVVRIDARIEEGDEGVNQDGFRSTNGGALGNDRERQSRFIAERYGANTLSKVNKFSLSRIEWLDQIYEQPE